MLGSGVPKKGEFCFVLKKKDFWGEFFGGVVFEGYLLIFACFLWRFLSVCLDLWFFEAVF